MVYLAGERLEKARLQVDPCRGTLTKSHYVGASGCDPRGQQFCSQADFGMTGTPGSILLHSLLHNLRS